MKEIILASNNKNKLSEYKEKLERFNINVISQKEAGFDIEVEEMGTTFTENAKIKAEAIYKLSKKPVISDDSGLEIDFLNGEPGVYSHRFAGPDATDKDRNNKVLKLMEKVQDDNNRIARFKCSICYIDNKGMEHIFEGCCEGKIAREELGNNNFGYDPIFLYGDKTFAQMTREEKSEVSHRGLAMKKFMEFINSENRRNI